MSTATRAPRVRKPINPRTAIRRAAARYARAAIAHSWMGSQPPEDHVGIVQEFDAATARLLALINRYVPVSEA